MQEYDPRFGAISGSAAKLADSVPQPQTVFGELADRSRNQNNRLDHYVGNLERLVERLVGNGQGSLGTDPGAKPPFAAISALGETFEDRVRLLDRLENVCGSLESLA
jgi:hypothetical protein